MNIFELRKSVVFLKKLDRKETLLGLYEAVTNLNLASLKKDSQEIAKRLSNILIGTAVAADTFKIKNLDKALDNRVRELQKLLK